MPRPSATAFFRHAFHDTIDTTPPDAFAYRYYAVTQKRLCVITDASIARQMLIERRPYASFFGMIDISCLLLFASFD